ncbi:RNA polymerase sigma factor [Novosphingobium resinovorum]|uniref:RNA polymerase sigma factor n=1 Tax=Novosphingobium resinovorum TaxID=158500 RepID=UPI002ECFB675|nr:RNA polymerase sigma factor [Novosphingobium resinovorum]
MPTNASSLLKVLIAERPAIMARIRRIVGSEATAEDVIQALWFRIRDVADTPRILSKRSYLYRLAINLALDQVRADNARLNAFQRAQAHLWAEAQRAPTEQEALDRDELARVLAAADGLDEPTRSMFILNRFEGLRQSEIAVKFAVSTTTVENHIRRALEQLRRARGPQ